MKSGVRCCHKSRVLLGSYLLFPEELLLLCRAKHNRLAQQCYKANHKCVGCSCNCKDVSRWSCCGGRLETEWCLLEKHLCLNKSKCSVLFGGYLNCLLKCSLIIWNSPHFLQLRVYMRMTALYDPLTLRRLMSYIYGAPILDVSKSHTTTQHSR